MNPLSFEFHDSILRMILTASAVKAAGDRTEGTLVIGWADCFAACADFWLLVLSCVVASHRSTIASHARYAESFMVDLLFS